MPSTIQFPLLS